MAKVCMSGPIPWISFLIVQVLVSTTLPQRRSSNRHRREVMAQRHVLRDILLGNAPLDLVFSVLHPADVAVNDSGMVLLADELVALRMLERILHLHAFERHNGPLDILAGLVSRGLDCGLDRENVLPGLPAMALVHDAGAADLLGVDVVYADKPVELLVVL